MFFSKHRLKMTLLRIGKHRILKNIASLRKVNIAHPYREVGSCTVCYIPHIGHLVAMPIKQAVVEQGFDYKNIPGYQFVFENNGSMLYRNECTESLDDKLGDVVLDITRIEMRIQAQLTEQVLDARICLDKAIRWVSSFCASPVEKKYYHCI